MRFNDHIQALQKEALHEKNRLASFTNRLNRESKNIKYDYHYMVAESLEDQLAEKTEMEH